MESHALPPPAAPAPWKSSQLFITGSLTATFHLVIMPNMKTSSCKLPFENKELRRIKADIFKALAHPTRLWMVEQLMGGERCVCTFVESANVDFSTISKHLSILKTAGIVADDKRGKQVFYRLIMPCVVNMLGCVEGVVCRRVPPLPDKKHGEPS